MLIFGEFCEGYGNFRRDFFHFSEEFLRNYGSFWGESGDFPGVLGDFFLFGGFFEEKVGISWKNLNFWRYFFLCLLRKLEFFAKNLKFQ